MSATKQEEISERVATLTAQQGPLRAKMIVLKTTLEEKREEHYSAYAKYKNAQDAYETIERELAEYEKVTIVPEGRSGRRKQTGKKGDFAKLIGALTKEQRISLLKEVGLLPN